MVTSLPLVISVIIYSGRQADILACLDSFHQSSYPNSKTMVLDYILNDGMVHLVRDMYPNVQVVEINENLGYAGNNNVGIQLAMDQGAEWIFILNDDTVLDPGCLASLIDASESDPSIGFIGPTIYHFREPEIIQSAGGMLGKYWQGVHLGQDEVDRGQFHSSHDVEWISGCAILVRCAVIEKIGMLDPDYFLYWEETEWCLRARRTGWKIVHVPQARLWHKGVQRDYQPKPYVTYYVTRNHLFTLSKHHAPVTAWVYTLFQIFRSLISWTIKPRWRFKREHRDAMWQGFIDFLRHRRGPMPSRSGL